MVTVKPDWQTADGSIALFCDDCLRVLPELEAGSVDAVVTDIPYGEVNRDSGGLRNLDKGAADVVTFSLAEIIEESSRLANSVYVFCGTEQVSDLRAGFVESGMTTRLCIWDKTNASPMNGERLWLSSIECCIFARKPLSYFGEHCAPCVWRGPTEREPVHPTQKPEWLIRRLVRASVPEHGRCLDFCMGSGTTGVACVRTGRRFIGIEKEPRYFEIGVKRIQAELTRHPLLESAPALVQRELLQ